MTLQTAAMKVEIVHRSFVKLADREVELREHLAGEPDSTARHWSSCCAFLPSLEPDDYAEQLRGVIKQPLVLIVPAYSPASGVWLRGPHYQLTAAIEALGMGWSGA